MMRNFMWDGVWRFGANFVPSTAINQLEMWQAESFDLETVDRELGWAEKIGMSTMRVFLHDLLYEADAEVFIGRIDRYLESASRHSIKTIFVFFDDCWNNEFALGKQPEPKPFTHNSGWVQSPGHPQSDAPAQQGRLERYVKGILTRFGSDPRILMWDLYNEPGARDRDNASLPLLKRVFAWAKEANPSQPITVGVWNCKLDELNRFSLEQSDVISFHCYTKPDVLEERCSWLRMIADGRPMVCTEYMARTAGSTFAECLPVLKEHNITAVNWGLVSGKTQTIYPWGWGPEKGVPDPLFHDVFHADGSFLVPDEAKVFAEASGI